MVTIKLITYEQSRIQFFKERLAHAQRQLEWAVKHSSDPDVCAEKGETVAFFQDAVDLFEKQEDNENAND